MEREIKFRVWLIVENDFNDEGYKMIYDLAFEEYLPVNDQLSSVKHLMQYTGLLDKNGKEIYEGDIVKSAKSIHDKNGVVEFYKGSFILRFDNEYYALGFYENEKGEVIGNIYQNPELLESVKK
jgi:uncharacterized phage protein (TIGR01671 family)